MTRGDFHDRRVRQEIINHITVRVPGPAPHFLINPFGLYYGEVTASNLVKVRVFVCMMLYVCVDRLLSSHQHPTKNRWISTATKSTRAPTPSTAPDSSSTRPSTPRGTTPSASVIVCVCYIGRVLPYMLVPSCTRTHALNPTTTSTQRTRCVIHTHNTCGVAVACKAGGLSMDNFYAIFLHGQVCSLVLVSVLVCLGVEGYGMVYMVHGTESMGGTDICTYTHITLTMAIHPLTTTKTKNKGGLPRL